MAIQYQLTNGNHWQQKWSGSFTARPAGKGRHYRIPEIVVPYSMDKHIIGIWCTSKTNPGHWRIGGLMNIKIRTNILAGGRGEAQLSERQKIWLDQITLFTLPKLSPEYELSFNPPFWFDHWKVSVHEYHGPEIDTTETKIDAVQTDVTAIRGHLGA